MEKPIYTPRTCRKTFHDTVTSSHALEEDDRAEETSVQAAEARAGPFDIRPPLPGTTTTSTERPLGGPSGLLGGAGLPELGPGAPQPSSSPGASLILGAFQAIITPFNPSMLGSVIGALGGGAGGIGGPGGGGGNGAPGFPTFPIGSKPESSGPSTSSLSIRAALGLPFSCRMVLHSSSSSIDFALVEPSPPSASAPRVSPVSPVAVLSGGILFSTAGIGQASAVVAYTAGPCSSASVAALRTVCSSSSSAHSSACSVCIRTRSFPQSGCPHGSPNRSYSPYTAASSSHRPSRLTTSISSPMSSASKSSTCRSLGFEPVASERVLSWE
uniref:Uncharacterized protein n=1 Tax=Anopheles atroparvus TaxID=41427 RepID=A0A182JL56_ANOAO